MKTARTISCSLPRCPMTQATSGERLSAERKELVRAWKSRSAGLDPHFGSTDILSVLLLASQIFNRQLSEREQRMPVIFSDMRHHTRDLDMESASVGLGAHIISKTTAVAPTDLRQVRVYALGVDSVGRPIVYWQGLKGFWARYLQSSGATLDGFSILRELPATP